MDKCLLLSVVNVQQLASGLRPRHTFTSGCGLIGAGSHADWVLKDQQNSVVGEHCQIEVIDGKYCLTDLNGDVFINNTELPIGRGRKVRLQENDHLLIGIFNIRIQLSDGDPDSECAVGRKQLVELVSQGEASTLLRDGEFRTTQINITNNKEVNVKQDPILALDKAGSDELTNTLLDDQKKGGEEGREENLLGSSGNETELSGARADSEFDADSALSTRQQAGSGSSMNERELELMEQDLESDIKRVYGSDNLHELTESTGSHLATGPLFRGLGVQLGNVQDSGEMQSTSLELGRSLQAAVKGLLSLHQNVNRNRYGHINKNLQPIEDNPLRLGLSYDETMRTLFDHQGCVVHLSSSAAIQESLKTIEFHNQAVEDAISLALDYILRAFSPDGLQTRFQQYRRAGEVNSETSEHWAWNMYQNYYRELTSDRQQGFDKLFWEVFEQAYDRKLRELQREMP